MKLKLKELYCSVIKLNNEGKAYVDIRVKLCDSPWVDYLNTGSTDKLYESFRATQKHPDHPDNYWYPIEKFGLLVENIKKYGYKNSFCNNKEIQDKLNGDNWPGGKGPIKIGGGGKIGDGHHRCCILYYLYGGDYEIEITNCLVKDIPPINI
jgi:hypothetical protein